MRTDLKIDDLDGFLDEPIVAVLATVRRGRERAALARLARVARRRLPGLVGGERREDASPAPRTSRLDRRRRVRPPAARRRGSRHRRDHHRGCLRDGRADRDAGTSGRGRARPTSGRSAGTTSRSGSSPAIFASGTSPTRTRGWVPRGTARRHPADGDDEQRDDHLPDRRALASGAPGAARPARAWADRRSPPPPGRSRASP